MFTYLSFLLISFRPWSSEETDNNETDNNEADNNDADNNETDNNETDNNEADNNDADNNETDNNEADNNETDKRLGKNNCRMPNNIQIPWFCDYNNSYNIFISVDAIHCVNCLFFNALHWNLNDVRLWISDLLIGF